MSLGRQRRFAKRSLQRVPSSIEESQFTKLQCGEIDPRVFTVTDVKRNVLHHESLTRGTQGPLPETPTLLDAF